METYNNNFLTEERQLLENTLLKVAIKIRDKIKNSNNPFLLTQQQKKEKDLITDTLYGYIYDDTDILEREVKGFCVNPNGALFICMDVTAVSYVEKDLPKTFDDMYEDVWYLILDEHDNLTHSEDCAILLTLLSISECIYQYFE